MKIPFASPLVLLAALLAVSGCASPIKSSEPRRLLLAYDGPVLEIPTTPRPRLVLRGINVPDYLDRRELVRRSGTAEVVRDRTAYWAERPSKAITRWVTLALAAQRADYAVESFTTADGRAPDALLSITLDGFEPGADGIVRVRGTWTYSPNGKTATRSGRFDADADAPAGTAEASVAALQQALGKAVSRLAADLPAATLASLPAR